MLKLRYDLSIWESAMFGGGDDDPALNFDGTSIYGELTHPFIPSGDFEVPVVFNTTTTGWLTMVSGELQSTDTIVLDTSSTVMRAYAFVGAVAQTPLNTPIAGYRDGEDHTALLRYTGTTAELWVDGVLKDSATWGLDGNQDISAIGCRTLATRSNYFLGQIKLIKFIDKSGASDVIQTFILNNKSTTSIPIIDGGPEAITLNGVSPGDWSS